LGLLGGPKNDTHELAPSQTYVLRSQKNVFRVWGASARQRSAKKVIIMIMMMIIMIKNGI
jgi:hypothetical protein